MHDFFLHIFLLEVYKILLIKFYLVFEKKWIPHSSKKKVQTPTLMINTWFTKSEV